MTDCVFCKILKGDLPAYKIYEDDFTLAFLDNSKDVDGHTLVIPKKHYVSILDIENYMLERLIFTIQKISKHYVNNCGFSGINLLNSNQESAGQSVPHIHFHLFPRKENDNVNLWPNNNLATKSFEEMQKILQMN